MSKQPTKSNFNSKAHKSILESLSLETKSSSITAKKTVEALNGCKSRPASR